MTPHYMLTKHPGELEPLQLALTLHAKIHWDGMLGPVEFPEFSAGSLGFDVVTIGLRQHTSLIACYNMLSTVTGLTEQD